MARIFRKTRKRLLVGNKFSKYFMYAAGEIFLIVIGILIALWINNWNQKRVLQSKEQFYLAGLHDEFQQSKAKLQTLIDINRSNYSKLQKIANFVNDSVASLRERELSEVLYTSFSFEIEYNPNNSLLNELIHSGGLNIISNEVLRQHITGWESMIQSVRRQERTLQADREKALDLFRRHGSIKTILDDAGVSKEIGLAHSNRSSNLILLTSPEFENHLLLFMLTTMITEKIHYQPLLDEINFILALLEEDLAHS